MSLKQRSLFNNNDSIEQRFSAGQIYKCNIYSRSTKCLYNIGINYICVVVFLFI